MIVLRPAPINDTTFTSSNITENDATAWASGTTYAANAEVMRLHAVYRSLKDNNTGNPPEDDSLTNPVNWARVRATNKWAMFSNQINDQSSNASTVDVTITPGVLVNGLAAFNVDAASIQVIMTDPTDGEVYNETHNLVENSGVNDWYSWYFEPIIRQKTLALLDLPPYASATVRVVVSQPSGTAKIGLLTMGNQQRLGDTDHGTSVGIVDYSRKERDTFGNPVIIQRNFSKRGDYIVTVPTEFVNSIELTLANLRTTPMTYIGAVNRPSTIIYGYYRDFSIVLSNPTTSRLSIDVEGLT